NKLKRNHKKFEKITENINDIMINSTKITKENLKTEFMKNFEEIKQIFKEQPKVLIETNEEKLKLIQIIDSSNNKINKTYAEVIKQNNGNQNNEKMKSKEVILIYPKENQSITSEQLKNEVKTKLDLKQIGNIGINNIRKIKNNGLLIECNDKK
ncbi:unnamed protein product, partial [Sphagnum compactum]